MPRCIMQSKLNMTFHCMYVYTLHTLMIKHCHLLMYQCTVEYGLRRCSIGLVSHYCCLPDTSRRGSGLLFHSILSPSLSPPIVFPWCLLSSLSYNNCLLTSWLLGLKSAELSITGLAPGISPCLCWCIPFQGFPPVYASAFHSRDFPQGGRGEVLGMFL